MYSTSKFLSFSTIYFRASTAPPRSSLDMSDPSYYGVMPFNRSLAVIDDHIRARAASVEPVGTYRRAYTSYGPCGATTSFDYKVGELVVMPLKKGKNDRLKKEHRCTFHLGLMYSSTYMAWSLAGILKKPFWPALAI